jgi:hypothetical protein
MASTASTSMPWPASSWVVSRPITPGRTPPPSRRGKRPRPAPRSGRPPDPVEGADIGSRPAGSLCPSSRSPGARRGTGGPTSPRPRHPREGLVTSGPTAPTRPTSE